MVAGIGVLKDTPFLYHTNVRLRDGTEIQVRRIDLVEQPDGSLHLAEDALIHVFPKQEVIALPPERLVHLSVASRARIDEAKAKL